MFTKPPNPRPFATPLYIIKLEVYNLVIDYHVSESDVKKESTS